MTDSLGHLVVRVDEIGQRDDDVDLHLGHDVALLERLGQSYTTLDECILDDLYSDCTLEDQTGKSCCYESAQVDAYVAVHAENEIHLSLHS